MILSCYYSGIHHRWYRKSTGGDSVSVAGTVASNIPKPKKGLGSATADAVPLTRVASHQSEKKCVSVVALGLLRQM